MVKSAKVTSNLIAQRALTSICYIAKKQRLEAYDKERILYLALRGLQELKIKE